MWNETLKSKLIPGEDANQDANGDANADAAIAVIAMISKKRQRKFAEQNLLEFHLFHDSSARKALNVLKEQKKKSKEFDERLLAIEKSISQLEQSINQLL